VIFVDTSALYALVNQLDPKHDAARKILSALVDRKEGLLTHNYVLLETTVLLHRRMGPAVAAAVRRHVSALELVWVDSALHERADRVFSRASRRNPSFVDCVSFVVMRERGLTEAFAFDVDFEKAGFKLLRA
jgi:predicted nucleic acid-binding protein